MVFRLAATAFYAVTYPGRKLAERVRARIAGAAGIPVRTVAVGRRVSPVELDRMDRATQSEVAREVDGHFDLQEGESLTTVVAYEAADSYRSLLVATIVPFLVLSALAFLIAIGTLLVFDAGGFLTLAGFWFAFSVGGHAFPDWVGARRLLDRSREERPPLAVVGAPFAALAVLVNLLRRFRVDALYGAGLVAAATLVL